MPIRKPLEKPRLNPIEQGAPVKGDKIEKEWIHINLRAPASLIHQVNEALEERVGISRVGWILEAIQEKLKGIKSEK